MRIGGIDPKTLPCEEVLVLPRGDERIVFRATGIRDMEEFDKLCSEPKPPKKLTKDGEVADTDDKGYKATLESYYRRRTAYVVVQSLQPSQIEWDTVKLENPATWLNWETDLKDAGLSTIECGRVMRLVEEANCLNEEKLKKARQLFLQGTLAKSAE